MTNHINIWDESAEIYADLSPKISFYQETSSYIFEFSDVQECQNIIDLGCGSSGLVALKAIEKYPSLKSIYCVDASEKMVQECEKRVASDKAIFIHSSAEHFDREIPEKADLILVNSAFWLFHISECLASVYNALSDLGSLVFNFAEWDYEFLEYIAHPKYKSIDTQLEKRKIKTRKARGSQKKFTELEIHQHLSRHNLKSNKIETIEIDVKKEDWLHFYSIPTIIHRSLPNLPSETAKEVLKDAIMELSPEDFPPVKWIFYRVEKNS